MAKEASKSCREDAGMPGGTLVNTDDPELEYAIYAAERRVLEIQAKLHRWAVDDPHRRFGDLFNLVADPGIPAGRMGPGPGQQGREDRRGGRPHGRLHRGGDGRRGVPRRAAGLAEGPQFLPAAVAGAADPETGHGQAPPPGDQHDPRPGGPGVLEAGAGADLRGGFPPVFLRVPPRTSGPRRGGRGAAPDVPLL